MVNILLAEGCDDIFDDGKVITVLDQACGTGGMLSTSYNFIKRYNPTADVRLFGQEINPESYAICLAEMMIKGQHADNICYQDTMKADRFKGTKMRFVIENPPFGTPWGGKDAAEGVEAAVQEEYTKGFDGRWGAGLPGSGDMQMLFLQSAIDKMDDNLGRAAIIENGSPLFTGGTASGESQIRRWMLENDLIEAIIALPTDLFYNTGIATYIWVLSKNKRPERKGKIQLIDASGFFKKLRKALGDKKNEISPEDRTAITKLYADFVENEYCKIYPNEEFIYREYTVMQPLQRSYAITIERIEAMLSKGTAMPHLNRGSQKGKKPRTTVWGKLLICECGHTFNMRRWDRSDRQPGNAYQCYSSVRTGSYESRKKKGLPLDGICQSPMIPEWRLQMMANLIFRKYLSEKGKVLALANSILEAHISDTEEEENTQSLLEAKQAELARLHKKMDAHIEMRAEGDLSREMFRSKCNEVEPKINRLQEEIKTLSAAVKPKAVQDYTEKLTVLQYALERYTNIDEGQNVPDSVIEAFVVKIVVSKDGFDWYLRFDGDPDKPLHCQLSGKRKTNTKIMVSGDISPTMDNSTTGSY